MSATSLGYLYTLLVIFWLIKTQCKVKYDFDDLGCSTFNTPNSMSTNLKLLKLQVYYDTDADSKNIFFQSKIVGNTIITLNYILTTIYKCMFILFCHSITELHCLCSLG